MISVYLMMLDEEGEKKRFEEIYDKYKLMMGKMALSILGDEEQAFDATHNALVAIAKNIKSFPDSTNEPYERAYVQKVVRNFCINEIHKRKKYPKTVNVDFNSYHLDVTSLDDEIAEKDVVDIIIKYIEGMSETYKSVLTMKYVYEMSAREISVALGLSENTVWSQIRRGTMALQKAMEKEGVR